MIRLVFGTWIGAHNLFDTNLLPKLMVSLFFYQKWTAFEALNFDWIDLKKVYICLHYFWRIAYLQCSQMSIKVA